MSFEQKKYIDEFNKKTYKMYQFRVRRNDKKMIRFLDSKEKRNSYILSLIENDLDAEKVLTLSKIKRVIRPILNEYGIRDIYLFGSYARGDAGPDSDVDIYCDKGKVRSLIGQAKLNDELEKALDKKVDIVFIGSDMDKFFEKQIQEDMIKLC